MGAYAPSIAGKWWPNLKGKVVNAPPGRACTPGQSKSRFFEEIGQIRTVVIVNSVVLACV